MQTVIGQFRSRHVVSDDPRLHTLLDQFRHEGREMLTRRVGRVRAQVSMARPVTDG